MFVLNEVFIKNIFWSEKYFVTMIMFVLNEVFIKNIIITMIMIMFVLNEVFIKNIFWSEKCNKSYVSKLVS